MLLGNIVGAIIIDVDESSLDVRKTCHWSASVCLRRDMGRTFQLSLQGLSNIMCCFELLLLVHDDVNLDIVLVTCMVCSGLLQSVKNS